MNKLIKMPFGFAVFLEILLIIASFGNQNYIGLAVVNGILIFGKPISKFLIWRYTLKKTYRKVYISSNRKQEKKINKILYRNSIIYSINNTLNIVEPKILFDVRNHIYSNSEIVSFIIICSNNCKNIFEIMVEFSKNYVQPPENIVHSLCIIENQIRFLTVIAKMYELKIINQNKKYSENINNIKNEKEYKINELLHSLITLNSLMNTKYHFNKKFNTTNEELDKLIHTVLYNVSNEIIYSSIVFEKLNDEMIDKITNYYPN